MHDFFFHQKNIDACFVSHIHLSINKILDMLQNKLLILAAEHCSSHIVVVYKLCQNSKNACPCGSAIARCFTGCNLHL